MNTRVKKTDWVTTTNRFVAFFDILGFKDLVMRNTHKNIYEILYKIAEERHRLENMNNEHDFNLVDFMDTDVYIVNFSDSIIIFSKNDDINNFNYFNFIVTYLFSYIIDLGLPLKAGVAHGEISVNKQTQIYFGQPIIDAYLIEEDVNYLGIVAHHSLDNYYKDLNNDEKLQLTVDFFTTKTPMKSGMINHINYNWFREYFAINSLSANIENFNQKINSFNHTVSGSPRRYIDNTKDLFNRAFSEKLIK